MNSTRRHLASITLLPSSYSTTHRSTCSRSRCKVSATLQLSAFNKTNYSFRQPTLGFRRSKPSKSKTIQGLLLNTNGECLRNMTRRSRSTHLRRFFSQMRRSKYVQTSLHLGRRNTRLRSHFSPRICLIQNKCRLVISTRAQHHYMRIQMSLKTINRQLKASLLLAQVVMGQLKLVPRCLTLALSQSASARHFQWLSPTAAIATSISNLKWRKPMRRQAQAATSFSKFFKNVSVLTTLQASSTPSRRKRLISPLDLTSALRLTQL